MPASAAEAQPFVVGVFRPWSGYAIPNGVWLTGDFNGDGKQDIAHAVQGADYVHVWTSNGTGGFTVTTFRPWAGYAIPNGVWLTGDFNGDGRTDLFHAVANTDYAHIWTSTGGGNFTVTTFRPWSGYAIPNGVWLTGDFNGDGRTDVLHAVANTDYAHLWTSSGSGNFTVTTFRPWSGYAIPNGVWLTGDFNGDRRSDVFHAVAGADYAHVWTSNGTGGFTVGTVRPWAGYAIPNGLWFTGDFDGDGRTDVMHAVASTDYVHVWTATGGGSFSVGTFRPWSGYAIPNGEWRTGDYDGDGRTDVLHAVANTDYVHLWRSQGGGNFAVSTFSPWAGYAIPNGLWLPADISGDGKTDIVHAVQNTDYAHPWISAIPGPVAGGGQVSVEGLEVTQVIQDMPHSVALVAGKSTIVRAYLGTGSASAVTVRGVLAVRDPATGVSTTVASTGTATVNPAQNGQLRPKRESLAASLVFAIPAAFTGNGTKEFALSSVTNAATSAAIACTNCGAARRSVGFVSSSPLRLRVVGLQYTTGTPPSTVTNAPRAVDFALVQSWIGRAYPIAQLISSQVTVNATAAWPFTCGDANSQLAAQRALDVSGGTDARTHYLGIVSVAGGYMRGCSSGTPPAPDPTVVASGPTGPTAGGVVPVNVAGDPDASFGDWYGGHELAHTFGRLHPGFCNGNSSDDAAFPFPNGQLSGTDGALTGLDVGDPANGVARIVLPGASRFEIMTYCNQPQWLTAYTYQGIRARLNAENPVGTGAPGGGAGGGAVAAPARAHAAVVVPGDTVPGCRCEARASRPAPPEPVTGAARPAAVRSGRDSVPAVPPPAGREPYVPEVRRQTPDPRPALAAPPEVVRGIASLPAAVQEPREPPPQVQLRTGRYVNIVARVNLTRGTARIRFVNQVDRALVPVGQQSDRARLRTQGQGRKLLAEFSVWVREDTDIPPGEDRMGIIDAVIPFDPQTRYVELLLGDRVADSIVVSRRPPVLRQVRAAADSGGRYEPGRRPQERGWAVGWTAVDADGDSLRYVVQVSEDEGRSWQTVAVGVRDPRLVVSPNAASGRRPVLVRVIANDGWWSSDPMVARLPSLR